MSRRVSVRDRRRRRSARCPAQDWTPRFELVWRQRLPDPDTLRLGRADDDLLVTIDGFRYPVRLPSVLRRCDAVDAQWDDDRLRVVFAPDPAVWPVR